MEPRTDNARNATSLYTDCRRIVLASSLISKKHQDIIAIRIAEVRFRHLADEVDILLGVLPVHSATRLLNPNATIQPR